MSSPQTEPRQVALVRAVLGRTAPDWTVVREQDVQQAEQLSARRLKAAKDAKANVQRLRRTLADVRLAAGLGPGAQAKGKGKGKGKGKRARLLTTLTMSRAQATLAEAIMAGADLDEALASTARALADAGESYVALLNLSSAAEGLPTRQGTPHLIAALAAGSTRMSRARKVVSEAARADPMLVRRWAAPHVIRAALAQSQHDVVSDVLARAGDIPTDDLVSVAQMLLRHEDWTNLEATSRTLSGRSLTEAQSATLGDLQAWLSVSGAPRTDIADGHAPVVSVLAPDSRATDDEDRPGQLVAFSVVDALLDQFVPGLRVHAIPQSHPSATAAPEESWALVTGSWQRTYTSKQGAPIPFDGHRAIVIGWRPGNPAAVGDEVLDALRLAAPVGCADWSGVDLLLGAGIPAFFSGPVAGVGIHGDASTLGSTQGSVSLDSAPWPGASALSARMHAAVAEIVPAGEQSDGMVVDDAEIAALLVSRGASVVPAPPTPGAPAWDGLLDVDDDPDSHRDRGRRLRHELEAALRLVAADVPAEDVRRYWRDAWRSEVAVARARRAEPAPSVEPMFDLASAVARIRQGRVDLGPESAREDEVHVALASDTRLLDQVPVALEGLTVNTPRPLTVWLLHRGFSSGYMAWLSTSFPTVRFRFLPCASVSYPEARLFRHISEATMDRLLLPELVCDTDTIVYLDIDALACDDVGELADIDLGGLSLAARPERGTSASMLASAFRASSRLPMPQASELRRTVLSSHRRDAPGINAGVLVLSLEELRRRQFCESYLGWIGRYRLHDQSLLLFFAGPERFDLPKRWNMWPAKEKIENPGVLHWIGPRKPWSAKHVPNAHRWLETQHHLESRLGTSISSARERADTGSSEAATGTTGV